MGVTWTRRRSLLAALAVVGVILLAWHFRWGIGLKAVEIVDPVVRRWASSEVSRLSGGVYQLTASPIHVDVASRRIAIDTILVVTDFAANAQRSAPLPSLTLRFHRCAIHGVDLDGLATGEGFTARRAGCDTVAVSGEVPRGVASDSTGSFLALREDLDLSRRVPAIVVDSVVFPAVGVALGINGRGGGRTAVSFDRLSVMFDSLDYRRGLPRAERRTLFSHNVRVALDSFAGSREASDRLEIAAIRGDLVAGTFTMRGFAWSPLPGAFADSLGLRALELDSLALDGVDWRAFLTRGDAVVRTLMLRGVRLGVSPGTATVADSAARSGATPWALERSLRSLARGVRLDSLDARDVAVTQTIRGSEAVTTAAALTLAEVRFGFVPEDWSGSTPIGPVRLTAQGVTRRREDLRAELARFALDLGDGRARATGVSYGHVGTDAEFVRRRRWRADRIAVQAESLLVEGIDQGAWVRRAAYRARAVTVAGLHLDVYSDKRMPARARRITRRHPQQWLATSGLDLHVDTATIRGRVTYRERGTNSPRTGTLRFENVVATLANAGTDRSRMTGAPVIRFHASTRLMGVSPLDLTVTLPPFAEQFEMDWHGTLGRMPMAAMNELVTGVTDIRFNGGTLERLAFRAETRGGVSRGTAQPRWRELSVDLPGVARTGILQGVRRAIAKFAANQFVVRRDNFAGMAQGPPVDGDIVHRWNPRETLIQHLWNSLKDALVATIRL